MTPCASRAQPTTAQTRVSSSKRSRRDSPTTSASCSTPRAPPASPRACCQTHAALIAAARGGIEFDHFTDATKSSPTCRWRGSATICSRYAQWLVAGFTINCPESAETVMTDLREIGPTYYFAPPRVFENLLTQVMIRMEDASAIKRWLFHHFMAVARRCGAEILDGKPVAAGRPHRCTRSATSLVYGPLRNVLGMSRIRVAYTGGRRDRSGPVPLLPLDRHQPEAALRLDRNRAPTCACSRTARSSSTPSACRAPASRSSIADNGEVLVRGADAAQGVLQAARRHRGVDRRRTAISTTGDAGFFDADGHLKIIDRAKDVGKLATMRPCSRPTTSRTSSSSFRTSRKPSPSATAATSCAPSSTSTCRPVGNWAERRGLAYSGYADLAGKPEVYELIRECVEQVNADLARRGRPRRHRRSTASWCCTRSSIPDDDELTRTRKVRRGFVAEKYARADRRAL